MTITHKHYRAMAHAWRAAIDMHGPDIEKICSRQHIADGFVIEPDRIQFWFNSPDQSTRLIVMPVEAG